MANVFCRIEPKAWNPRINREKIAIEWKFTRKMARLKLNYLFKRSTHKGHRVTQLLKRWLPKFTNSGAAIASVIYLDLLTGWLVGKLHGDGVSRRVERPVL